MNGCKGSPLEGGPAVEIRFEGATIGSVVPAEASDGIFLAPGWIDLQVNGFGGVDYNDPHTPAEAIARSLDVLFSTGTTRFLATVITASPDGMIGALRNLAQAKDTLAEGDAIEGFHVEGPHISAEDGPRGAHPREWVRPPDFEEFQRWQEATGGRVRLVTLAPEWPEATAYIEKVLRQDVVVAIGHTQATSAQIADAVSAGASLSTHLGNGAHSVLRRHPNYIWDQLAEDRLMADFIADGIHLDAAFLKVALRAKGLERFVLVTDAVAPAAAPPGRYRIGELEVEMTADLRVVLAGQDRLAGSGLRMDRGLENLMRLAGMRLADAVRTATRNAARAGRIAGRERGLVAGDRGDVVQFRFTPEPARIEVTGTWVGGRRVFGE